MYDAALSRGRLEKVQKMAAGDEAQSVVGRQITYPRNPVMNADNDAECSV